MTRSVKRCVSFLMESIYTVIVIFVLILIFIVIFVLILLYGYIVSFYIPDITISVPAFSYISAVSGEIPESVITILMSSSEA